MLGILEVYTEINLLLLFFFFLITDRDCVALPSVDVESRPLRRMRLLLCAIQTAIATLVVKPIPLEPSPILAGTTHTCSSSSSKLMARVNVVCHHLQAAAPPQMLQLG